MDEDFGSSYITIEDEDGNEFELEQLAELEYEGRSYAAFLPADMDEDDPDYGYILLRIEEENGDEVFCSVDDERCTRPLWPSSSMTRTLTSRRRNKFPPAPKTVFIPALCAEWHLPGPF